MRKQKKSKNLPVAHALIPGEGEQTVTKLSDNKNLVLRNSGSAIRSKPLTTFAETNIDRQTHEAYNGQLAAIVESSHSAIISKSLNGVIKTWNKASEKMFGYTAKYAVGKNISLIIPTEYRDEEKMILEKIGRNETIDHYETVRKNKSGLLFHVSLIVSPLKDREGNIIGISKIASDITGQKKSEENLIRLNKELTLQNEEKEKREEELIIANRELAFQNKEKEKRAEELDIAIKELAFQNDEKEKRAAELILANKELAFQNEEKEKRANELIIANKGLKQFAFVASHDLQEPLRTISNYMQIFEEDYSKTFDTQAFSYLHSVNDATKRMSMVINSLLDFSRIGLSAKLTCGDCQKLLDDVIADLKSLIEKSNAVIEVGKMPKLNVYETQLRQVFQNLITNAIKFRKPDTIPQIQVKAELIDESWRFAVSDKGIGISSIHFERIFNIFQRLHTTAEYEGNGIGLANCRKIVQLHQGTIWVESELEKGTTFYFTIPTLTI